MNENIITKTYSISLFSINIYSFFNLFHISSSFSWFSKLAQNHDIVAIIVFISLLSLLLRVIPRSSLYITPLSLSLSLIPPFLSIYLLPSFFPPLHLPFLPSSPPPQSSPSPSLLLHHTTTITTITVSLSTSWKKIEEIKIEKIRDSIFISNLKEGHIFVFFFIIFHQYFFLPTFMNIIGFFFLSSQPTFIDECFLFFINIH